MPCQQPETTYYKKVRIDRGAHLEKFRLEKVEKARIRHPSAPERVEIRLPREETEEFVRIKLPRCNSKPRSPPDDDRAVWDEDLAAWVVRRAPRVRFT